MDSSLFSNNTRNKIALTTFSLLALFLLLAYSRAESQEELYLMDRQLYYSALAAGDQKNYEQAFDYLEETSSSFQSSWLYMYTLGYLQFGSGDFMAADDNLQEAEDIRPAFLTNADYLLIRGSVFISLGEYALASEYLEQAEKYVNSDKQKSFYTDLKSKIPD